jgi:general secretion pathway protein I
VNSVTKQRGFTLVEVMVALAIVAFALPALVSSLISITDGTAHMNDKNMAYWIADNQLTEFRLKAQLKRQFPRDGTQGEVEMAGRRWFWRLKTEGTEIPNFNRWEIRVSDQQLDNENSPALAELQSFMMVNKP